MPDNEQGDDFRRMGGKVRGWMTLSKAASRLEISVHSIHEQIRKGRLEEGVHYRKCGIGRIEIDGEAYSHWCANQFAVHQSPDRPSEGNRDDDDWLALPEAAEDLRQTEASLQEHIARGSFRDGVHLRRTMDGSVELNVRASLDWLVANYEPTPGVPRLVDRVCVRHGKSGINLPDPVDRAASVVSGPRLIPVYAWAEMMFGEYAPSRRTLARWCREARIMPTPSKIGREYFCSPGAAYLSR